jgi:hypothetical protein
MIRIPTQVQASPLTWTDVTGGGQDSNFNSFFTWCVANGVQHLSPSWEGNLADTTWPWGTLGNDTSGNQTGYVNAWIHIWNLANTIAPGYFKWWWCPDFPGGASNMTNWEPGGAYYPGDAYVDVIGLDIYNTWAGGGGFPGDGAMLTAITSGNAPNWNQCLAYAAAHGKALCVPEWGMNGNSSYPNGGDDTAYINNCWNLFTTAATSYGLTVYVFPWNNTGSAPISGYSAALGALTTNVATAISNNILTGPPAAGGIVRATSSAFPIETQNTGAQTITGVVLGAAGDLVAVDLVIYGTTAANVVATPANGMTFSKLSAYNSTQFGADFELWTAEVTAAAAGTTVSIVLTTNATTPWSVVVVDEFTAPSGANTVWTHTTVEPLQTASSTAAPFPSVTSPTSSNPMMYRGSLNPDSVAIAGYTNPVGSLTFAYSTIAGGIVVAFNGLLANGSAYQPSLTLSTAGISAGLAAIWTAAPGGPPPPGVTISPIANINGVVGTAIPPVTFYATGGVPPYTWTDTGIPTGTNLNPSTGVLSGTPTEVFNAPVVQVTATDSTSPTPLQGLKDFAFNVVASGGNVPNAPATINGVAVPQTETWGDEFPGPHLDVTKWLPGWFGDNSTPTGGSFGDAPNITFRETQLSIGANGLGVTLTGSSGGAISSGMINSGPWAGGTWTANTALGIPASAGPTFPGFVGFTVSPDGGGIGGTKPGHVGPVYVEFGVYPAGSGSDLYNWQQAWLVQMGEFATAPWGTSAGYADSGTIDEIDVMETGPGAASTVWHDQYSTGTRIDNWTITANEFHTVGVLWTTNFICFVYDGVIGSVYSPGGWYHPQNPEGIIVTQGYSPGYNTFFSPSTLTCRYVRVFQ